MKTDADRELIRQRIKRWARNALLVSVALHVAGLIVGAFIVAYRSKPKPDAQFVASPTPGPALEPRKLEHRVKVTDLSKRSARPLMQPRILAMSPTDLALPEIKRIPKTHTKPTQVLSSLSRAGVGTGIGGGDGSGMGGGLGGGLPLILKGRCDPLERLKRLNQYGGDPNTEKAVVKALNWFQATQNSNGSWGTQYPDAMTGLVLLAYLGHCETPDSPQFGATVRRAINYLIDRGSQGQFGRNHGQGAYDHAIATYALAEAYTMTHLASIRPVLEKAIQIIVGAQSYNAGWRYRYGSGEYDLSVTGWHVQALKATDYTGLNLPGVKESLTRVVQFIQSTQLEDGNFPYQPGNFVNYSMTGVGAYCLAIASEDSGRAVRKATQAIVLVKIPVPGKFDRDGKPKMKTVPIDLDYHQGNPNLYGWYYCTLACFQRGGGHWSTWNRKFQKPLLEAQSADGNWPVEHGGLTAAHGKGDATVYRTALCTLMLEVYYRYLPTMR